MGKYRQTLIWEFLNKKVLRPIDKLKVMCRLCNKFLFEFVNIDSYKRACELQRKFLFKLTPRQSNRYFSLSKKYCNDEISKEKFDNELDIFFNYYKA